MHVLLTGGTGFFGKALLRHWVGLARKGRCPPRVTVLSRDPSAFLCANPEFNGLAWLDYRQGDVLQPATLPVNAGFTHLLHAATDSTLSSLGTPLECFWQILDGTRNMLDYAAAIGVRRFLLTSSGAVYGRLQCTAGVSEGCLQMPDPLQASSAYGVAKRAAEHLTYLYAERFEVVIARCFAFVGRDLPLDVHFAIGNFIRDALAAPVITVNGDGTPLRSYLDQRDLAEWLLALLTRGNNGQAYNVGSSESLSIRELAYRVRDLLAPSKPVRIMGQSSDTPPQVYVPDVRKALEAGLKQKISLNDSIVDTASHARRFLRARPSLTSYTYYGQNSNISGPARLNTTLG